MIILELNENQLNHFKKQTENAKLNFEIVESKKLGGDEVIFQIFITAVSIAAPYVIDFFKSSPKDNKITLVKNGIKYVFESEDDLKKFLDSNP